MIRVRKIAHASYEMPDLDKQTEYYTEILGLTLTAKDKDAVYLANTVDHHSVVLLKGDAAQCTRVGFQIGPNDDLNEFENQVKAHGVKTQRKKDPEPTIADMLSFEDPKGTQIEVFKRPEFAGQRFTTKGVVPHKLGHVAFHCADVKAVARFYIDVLGFRESDWMADFFVFLRCGPDHHTINLMGTGSNRHFHTAFEVRDWATSADGLRFPFQERLPHVVGTGPAWHRPQHLRLSSQPERADHRIVRRARPDEGRGTRLFRAQTLAPRQSAEAEGLGEGPDGVEPLGTRAAGRDDEVTQPYKNFGSHSAIAGNKNIRTIRISGASRNGTMPRYMLVILISGACAWMTNRLRPTGG